VGFRDDTDRPYRRKLIRCLRRFVQESGELPPSLILQNAIREGKFPVRGGGYAVGHSFSTQGYPGAYAVFHTYEGHLEGSNEQEASLPQSHATVRSRTRTGRYFQGLRSATMFHPTFRANSEY
jgi:hypothetical protein